VYSQIGLVMLVGLITKHGILIVEFANQLRQRAWKNSKRWSKRRHCACARSDDHGCDGAGRGSRWRWLMAPAPNPGGPSAGSSSAGWSSVHFLTLFVIPTIYTVLMRQGAHAEAIEADVPLTAGGSGPGHGPHKEL